MPDFKNTSQVKSLFQIMLFVTVMFLGGCKISDIEFSDANLAACVAETALEESWVYKTQFVSLSCSNRSIVSLDGIEELSSIRTLILRNNGITDVEPLSDLNKVSVLNLSTNPLTDLTPLNNMTGLKVMDLSYLQMNDELLAQLSGHQKLFSLSISNNDITDVTPLSLITSLTHIYMNNNQVNDIGTLAKLPILNTLIMWENELSDLNPVSDFEALKTLNIEGNFVNDISALAEHKGLTRLYMSDNQVSDLTPLSALPELVALSLTRNLVEDLTPLENLLQLESLLLGNMSFNDVTALYGLQNLEYLDLRGSNSIPCSQLDRLLGVLPLISTHNNIDCVKTTPIGSATLKMGVKSNTVFEVFTFWLVIGNSGKEFEIDFYGNETGQTYDLEPGDEGFDDLASVLSNGDNDVFQSGFNIAHGGPYQTINEAYFFFDDRTGDSGVDFEGYNVTSIELVIDSVSLVQTPGWSDLNYEHTLNVYGELIE